MAKRIVAYPVHHFEPGDLLNFSELDWFIKNWSDLGLTDQDLGELQMLMMRGPKGGDVVAGTGGLRKLRFSPRRWSRGKSGALRVCYAYFEKYGFVVLVTVYGKNDPDDLSPAGRKAIKHTMERIEKALQKRFGF